MRNYESKTLLWHTLRHEDVSGRGGKITRVLNFGARWRKLAALTLLPIYTRHPLTGSENRFGSEAEMKIVARNWNDSPVTQPATSRELTAGRGRPVQGS